VKWWDSHCHTIALPSRRLSGGLVVTTQPSEWSLPSWLDDTDGWHFAIGLHPWFALTSVDWSYLELLLQSHVSLSVGEIGLDGVVRGVDMQSQLAVFEGQCRLAVQYDRVISLHLVKDAGKGLSILKGLNVRRAIVHGFVGSLEQAISYQRLGFYLGLGPRLFRGMTEKRMHMLQHIDKELVLLESDF